MTYTPPYIYTGLYEEESKSFEIVGAVRRESLISKSEQESLQKKPLRIRKMRGVGAENLYYLDSDVTRLIISACPPLVSNHDKLCWWYPSRARHKTRRRFRRVSLRPTG